MNPMLFLNSVHRDGGTRVGGVAVRPYAPGAGIIMFCGSLYAQHLTLFVVHEEECQKYVSNE